MSDCRQIAPLLQVYADDQASPDTNALVLDHLDRCHVCQHELTRIVSLKQSLRDALAAERAPAGLHARVVATLEPPSRRSIGALVLRWLVPAAAAAVIVLRLAPAPAVVSAQVESAVAQHVSCALKGRADRMLDTMAAQRGYASAMPWLSSSSSGVRVVEGHTCGTDHFAHLILDEPDGRASIFVAPRSPGGATTTTPDEVRSGDFDVEVLTTATHVAYLVVERQGTRTRAAWRKSAMTRVAQFLQQLEGP